MAELDDKILNSLDTRLKSLDQTLQSLQKRTEDFANGLKNMGRGDAAKKIAALNSEFVNLEKNASDALNAIKNGLKGTVLSGDLKREFRDLKSKYKELIDNINSSKAKMPILVQGVGATDALNRYNDAQKRIGDQQKKNNRHLKEHNAELDKMLPTLQRLASAFGIAFSIRGLAQFGKKLIETRGEFEMQFVAMKQIIGDVDAATKIWSQTMQMALQSPFKAMQLVDYTKKLAAYRIETEKLFDTTKRLADVSAGLGVDMQRLILAYGQVKAANYLRASEIRQFTEAGVNILGELAEYLTVVNGKMYTTATVMEMVTKRMIKFEDVEAIFKRMTDEGGIFFNMQEVQVDTVRGQMMKLQDAFDQMLNKIGSANQGTLREFIDALNSMVRNWQTFATFLKTNATLWLPMISVMKLAQLGLTKYGDTIVKVAGLKKGETFQMKASLVEETLLLNKNAKTITAWGYTTRMSIFKVEMAWKALTAAFKAFLPFLVVEGIVYIASAIANANKELDEFRNSINDFATDAESRLGESQKRFKELREELEKTTEGTEARREAVQKMNNQFGKYLNNLVSETMTLEELKAAYEGVEEKMVNIANLRLREEIKNKSSEQVKNIMQDLIEDMGGEDIFHFNVWKWDKEHTGLEKTGELSKKQAIGLTSTFVQALQDSVESLGRGLTKEELEDLALATYNRYLSQNIQEYSEYIDILSDLAQKGRKINSLLAEEMPVIGFDVYEEGESWKTGERQWREYLATQKEAFDIFKTQLDENIDNIEDYRKRLNEEIEKYDADIAEYAKSLAITTGYAPQAFSFRNFYYEVEPFDKNKIPQTTAELEQLYYQKGLRALKEMYPQALSEYSDDYAKAAKIILASTKDLEEGSQKYEETVKKEYKTEKEYLDWLKSKGDANEEEIAQQEALIKIYEKWAEIRDIDLSDNKKGGGTDTIYSDRIRLLQRMFEAYKKAAKEAYSFAVAEGKVMDSFENEWASLMPAGYGAEEVPTSYDALKTMLERLKAFTPQFDKDGKLTKAFKDLMSAVSDATYQIDFKLSVEKREEFQKQIEKMFSDYELTLNFESIGLPSDLAKKLFGVDTSSLDEISSYMKNFVSEHTSDWNDEINKVYINALQKISDKEQEMYKKNVSNLFKRVKNSADEMKTVMAQAAADINFADMLFDKQEAQKNIDTITEQIEKNIEEIRRLTPADGKATGVAAQQIARLEAENKILQNRVLRLSQMSGNLSAEQYTDLVKATMEHENEQLQKISLEQLKQLPEYIEAMGRTAGWSNEKLREMLDYLQNLISVSGGNIDITEYKSIINQIDKIQAEIKHNDYPFGREGFAKVAQMLQEQSEAEAKLNELTEERNQLIAEQKLLELEEIELQARLNELKAEGLDENSTEIQEIMDDIKSNQKFKISNLNAQKKNAAGIQTITKGNAQTMAIIDAIIHGINNLVQEIYQNLKKVEILLQDYEVDTEHGKWAKWSKGMETFAKASQDATNGWEAYKKGDIAGIVYEVINGITDIWHGINEMVSQKHVDTIYEMEQELERLTVAYEKLQKAIEKTWDTSSYMMNYEKMVKNLEDQRKALQAQYDAEDARKNSDEEKMKEYQNSIRDIDETLTELKQKQIEVFGGLGEVNYRSAAQEFVGAWKEAFLETGDGLQGLQDHFDEFLNEWFVKQATMRVAGRMLEPLFRQIDNAVDESSQGGANVLLSELQRVREKFATIAPQLSDSLEQLAGMWGLGEGEGGLSGLAAGIQGMTEEQANILEAYWNSVRMYTASIDMNVSRIADMLGVGSRDITNPQLQQLELIAHNTASIQRMFESVVMSGHTKGQSGIRVFVD